MRIDNRIMGIESALLIVDAQNGVFNSAYKKDEIIEKIDQMISKARVANTPIIWVQHVDAELEMGSEEWAIVARLKQSPHDYYIEKSYNSAFEDTNLKTLLMDLGVKKIILVGASTNWCIRSTAYAALEKGFDVCIISDAHTTESLENSEGYVVEAKAIIEEFNLTFKWLKYHNRINECRTASEYFTGTVP